MITIKTTIDSKNLRRKFKKKLSDEDKLKAAKYYADLVEPWVPYRTGELNYSVEVSPDGVTWTAPYAATRYYNSDGFGLTSFEEHPLASMQWDKVAMQSGQQDYFNKFVKDLITESMNRK